MEEFVISSHLLKRFKSYNSETGLAEYNSGTVDFGKISNRDYSLMPNYLRNESLVINFNNLAEVFTLTQKLGKPRKHHNSSQQKGYGSWVEFDTYEQAYNVLTKEPQRVVDFKANDIAINDYDESGNDVNYDVTGDFIDIGRYLDGVPETFGQMRQGNYRGVRVKIIQSGGGSCSQDIKIINARSRRISRLIDWLENQGIRVSLNVVYSNDNGHYDIKVKDYSEPLNIYNVGVASNGDFFRRMIFRLIEASKTNSSGYGSSIDFNEFMERTVKRNINEDNLDSMLLFISNSGQYDVKEVDTLFDYMEKRIQKMLEENDYKRFLLSRDIVEN